jgi:peptidoglycan/LPS O-acetylase OafA/YrhL
MCLHFLDALRSIADDCLRPACAFAPVTRLPCVKLTQMAHPPHGSAKLSYRRDIDGLRAVAVLLVVLNHLHIWGGGGYVGVDVFFVISGYLISAGILSEMASGTFSIAAFYERRVRRIFPALLVMFLGTTALAWRYYFPAEILPYARTLLAALLSVANMLFWHRGDYFGPLRDAEPLLHTWSLAVEEQFYIFFPLFLVAIRRSWPAKLKLALWLLTATTLLVSAFLVHFDSRSVFFLAPLRAWELLFGTLLSQNCFPPIRHALGREVAALAGLVLIFVPAALYNSQTVFPGLAALPPCLGTVLVIAAGEFGSSFTAKLLSLPPVVFLGLISYSLYLWHWPIFVFQHTNHLLLDIPDGGRSQALVLAVSLLVATLSWALVETPFRKGRLRPARRPLFLVNGTVCALVFAFAVLIIGTRGAPFRFSHKAIAMASLEQYDTRATFREGTCFLDPFQQTMASFDRKSCLDDTPGKKHYLLLGDSHAADLWSGLSRVFPELDLSQATVAACPPIFNEPQWTSGLCREMMNFIFHDYLAHHRVDTLVLSAEWFTFEPPEIERVVNWSHDRGIEVVVIGPRPEFNTPLPFLVAKDISLDPDALTRKLTPLMTSAQADLDRTLKDLAQNRWHIRYISYFSDVCEPRGGCPVLATPDIPMYFDQSHFTIPGSVLFAQAIRDRHQLP